MTNMPKIISIISAVLVAFHPAMASSNVEVEYSNFCASTIWPDTIGPFNFTFQAVSEHNNRINGLKPTIKMVRPEPSKPSDKMARYEIALDIGGKSEHPVFRCEKGVMQIAATKQPITIGPPGRSFLRLAQDGFKPELLVHKVEGVRQIALFVGAENQTTWGFKYESRIDGNDEYFAMRLLGLRGNKDWKPEFRGYLSIVEMPHNQ